MRGKFQFAKIQIRFAHMFAAKKVTHVAPKVIKAVTPWYLRWIYSICGDASKEKMATLTSTVAPEGASDSVVCILFFFSNKIETF